LELKKKIMDEDEDIAMEDAFLQHQNRLIPTEEELDIQ
jgi:hypothetical protein